MQANTTACLESSNWVDKLNNISRVDAQVKNYNYITGDLTEFDCLKCRNRGRIAENRNDCFTTVECECGVTRRNMAYIRESGLAELLGLYTFERYRTISDWQKYIKSKAMDYASAVSGDWLCVLGCVGAGKTHICTAVCGELMKQGYSLKYMLWRDESVRLKAVVNDREEYSRLIRPFKEADILYIDDLFKTKKDTFISAGDVNLAFELINYRYNQPNKKTVISSEMPLSELMNIDESVGSRIYERCKVCDYCLEITKTGENNFRLK